MKTYFSLTLCVFFLSLVPNKNLKKMEKKKTLSLKEMSYNMLALAVFRDSKGRTRKEFAKITLVSRTTHTFGVKILTKKCIKRLPESSQKQVLFNGTYEKVWFLKELEKCENLSIPEKVKTPKSRIKKGIIIAKKMRRNVVKRFRKKKSDTKK